MTWLSMLRNVCKPTLRQEYITTCTRFPDPDSTPVVGAYEAVVAHPVGNVFILQRMLPHNLPGHLGTYSTQHTLITAKLLCQLGQLLKAAFFFIATDVCLTSNHTPPQSLVAGQTTWVSQRTGHALR